MGLFGFKGAKLPKEAPAESSDSGGKPNSTPPRRSRRRLAMLCLHVALVAVALVTLTILNRVWGLERLLNSRWELLRSIWLPLLFFLAYLVCRLSWWAVRQLGPDRLTGEFADLERDWSKASQLIAENAIDVRRTPVFLVLGQPEEGVEPFFSASRWSFPVRFTSAGAEPSLQVYANRDGIFVVCGDSLLTATARYGRTVRKDDSSAAIVASAPTQQSTGNAGPSASRCEILPSYVPDNSRDRAGAVVIPRLGLVGEQSEATPRIPVSVSPFRDRELADRLSARLRALCRMIAHERRPLIPINGVLTLFPLFSTDSPDVARTVAMACRSDLQEIRETLGTECPHIAVVCDFQQVPGFDTLLSAFPDTSGQQWILGRTFPLVPDIEAAQWPRMIEQGLRWLSGTLWTSAVYSVMQSSSMLMENEGRFALLEEGWRRLHILPDIAIRCFHLAPPARPLFGGFSLSATGADCLREQGFVAGVLRWLVEAQDHVGWTEEALREDESFRRWAFAGSLVLAVFLSLLCALSVGLLV